MIVHTDNGPLYYEAHGEGPPLVFVSGWAMSCECWRPIVKLLSRRHRCIIYDVRGVGRSKPVSDAARFEVLDHADDLHSILESDRVFDAVIIGLELGALIAMTCVDRHPQDAKALVVVNPRAAIRETEILKLAALTPARLALREFASFPLIRNVVAWRFRRAPEPIREALFEDFANVDPRAAYQTARAAGGQSAREVEEWVGATGCPLLFVCGEKDRNGIARARELFAVASSARLATVRDAGFLPMLEYPKQFARLVEDFATTARGIKRTGLSLRRIR
jgi:pimeloyl-ACP methyl ester carboxylesterase